jgi:hypothetical protein
MERSATVAISSVHPCPVLEQQHEQPRAVVRPEIQGLRACSFYGPKEGGCAILRTSVNVGTVFKQCLGHALLGTPRGQVKWCLTIMRSYVHTTQRRAGQAPGWATSHSATPALRKATAVFAFMETSAGERLFRTGMPSA